MIFLRDTSLIHIANHVALYSFFIILLNFSKKYKIYLYFQLFVKISFLFEELK